MLELSKASWPAGRQPAVSGVDLRIEAGRPLAMVNLPPAHAAGLLRILQGEMQLASGSCLLGGKTLRDVKRTSGAIVRIGPEGARISGRTVQRTIEAIGRSVDATRLLSRTGLSILAEVQVRKADPAARVRLAIACALARKPGLIVLHAPASGMSGAARAQFLLDLQDMFAEQASVIVLVGSADEAMALGGDVAVFDHGAMVQVGRVADVFAHPRNLAVACATASPTLNLLPLVMEAGVGRMADGSCFTPPPGLALPEAGACTLAFRPDDLQRERTDPYAVRFVARINGADNHPSDYAHVTFGGAHWSAPASLAAGTSRVFSAFVDRRRLLVFDADGRAIEAIETAI